MKKIISVILSLALLVCSFTACGNGKSSSGDDTFDIVVTIFPEYDWVLNILGDNPGNAQVTLLLDNGVDLHSYQPTASDILKISTCDLFVYIGGESDEWVDDALKEAVNRDMEVLDLISPLGDMAKDEEHIEGMEENEEEEEGEAEYDEHIWLSLKNAAVLCEKIASAIAVKDPANEAVYKANLDAYIHSLEELDKRYEDTVSSSNFDTLVFADRFPFRYMVDDYGLSYYAAFAGCSAETEASFETVMFLSAKVDELSLRSVMVIEGGNTRIAETVIGNTKDKDQKILTLDSMQGTGASGIKEGKTYLSIMEKNLEVLAEALR